jgi:hypothetical protein
MSIDAKLDELIKALNRVADSNGALAQAYQAMAGAGDNGPRKTTAAPKAAPAELPGEPLPPATVPAAPAAPATTAPAGGPTFQDVRKALISLPRERVTELLAKFGADKLSAIDEGHYVALIAEAQGPVSQDPLL